MVFPPAPPFPRRPLSKRNTAGGKTHPGATARRLFVGDRRPTGARHHSAAQPPLRLPPPGAGRVGQAATGSARSGLHTVAAFRGRRHGARSLKTKAVHRVAGSNWLRGKPPAMRPASLCRPLQACAACAAPKTRTSSRSAASSGRHSPLPPKLSRKMRRHFSRQPHRTRSALPRSPTWTRPPDPDPDETPESAHCGRGRGKRRTTFAQDGRSRGGAGVDMGEIHTVAGHVFFQPPEMVGRLKKNVLRFTAWTPAVFSLPTAERGSACLRERVIQHAADKLLFRP